MRITVGLCFVLVAAGASGAEMPPVLAEKAREALPKEMRESFDPSQDQADIGGSNWEIRSAELDGQDPKEYVLLVRRPGKSLEAVFLAMREGKPWKKKVAVKGKPITSMAIRFHDVSKGRSLVHVDASNAGQLLLSWDGKDLSKVWEVGRARDDVRNWFTLEDLDGDGVAEVIAYVQRDLDVYYADEDTFDEPGGGEGDSAVDAVAVHRLEGGRWKKSADLLESLR